MVEESVEAATTAQAPAQFEELDDSWLTLQRTVAVGMIVVLAAPMVVVLQQFIPPLAIAGVLFAVALALTWVRPRAGALGIGVLAGLWLMWQLVNLSMVLPDLTRPSATLFFMITLGMIVFGAAGLVGLVGALRRAAGQLAVSTLQAMIVVLVGGLAISLFASL